MPGFVDVSNMSDWEIKMMHRTDEDYPAHQYRGRRVAPARAQSVSRQFAVADVWAAACAAQRVNGGYLKEHQTVYDETTQVMSVVRRRNRDVMMQFLDDPQTLTAADREAGEQCQKFLRHDLTFRALRGRLTDFDSSVSRCLAVENVFVESQHRLEMAVVASLPGSAARGQARQDVEERVKFATGGFIGKPNDKVQAKVEILNANFSQQWGCWWLKGITDQNQPVFFSYRESVDPGTWLTIQGTVKAHRDNVTQLNRVKVL